MAKGDLTASGLLTEYDAFLDCYLPAFGELFLQVRGNHDAFSGRRYAAEPWQELALPGVILAVLDTVIEGRDSGQVQDEQLEWLDELGARADRQVLVFGHHHPWRPGSANRAPTYFGINPEDSERLVEVIARRPAISGYFAGHTHRNRVRRFVETGDVPYVEVACVKDFPGSWAEYRVFEGGILQIHRRLSSSGALAWSEKCRGLFWGMYPGYALGKARGPLLCDHASEPRQLRKRRELTAQAARSLVAASVGCGEISQLGEHVPDGEVLRCVDRRDALVTKLGLILIRDDAADDDRGVYPPCVQPVQHLRHEVEMAPRQDRDADNIDVLVVRGGRYLIGGQPYPLIDDLEARVTGSHRNLLGTVGVPVEARFGDKQARRPAPDGSHVFGCFAELTASVTVAAGDAGRSPVLTELLAECARPLACGAARMRQSDRRRHEVLARRRHAVQLVDGRLDGRAVTAGTPVSDVPAQLGLDSRVDHEHGRRGARRLVQG